MADENKLLHLGNSSDKISYDKFKGKLEKKDIATNNKLLQIFNFFDKDGNGIIETANSKGVNEMQSLWNAVRTSATKNSNLIFEESEAQEFLANSVDSTGKSLADNQVTASDLFGFLKALVNPQATQANGVIPNGLKPEDIVEYTPEEIEDISIQTVTNGVKQAREVFDAQKAQQGKISDFVNETKETFDTEYASSRVNRYLMNEEFCSQALQQAQEGNLTEKEYLEAKIELAVRMLPELQSKELKSTIIKQILTFGLYKDFGNKTKAEQERIVKEMEIEYLKEALKNLTPEELTVFIKKVTSLSDDEYKEHAPKVVENLINQTIQKKEIDNKPVLSDSIQIKIVNPPRQGSIEDIVSHQEAYRVMEFEETFSKERGVEYNPEAIMNYSTKEAHLQFLVGMHNRNEALKNILHDATVAVDGNNKYGAPHPDAIETCNQNLANQIETAFRSLYSKNAAEAQRVIDEIMGQNSGIKVIADEQGNFIKLEFYGFKRSSLNLDLLNGTKPEGSTQESEVGFENNKFRMPINSYSLVKLSKGLQQKLEENYQTALKGKTLDEYSTEVKSAYQMAYGAKNAQDMANAFAQSQQEGVQNTKAVVQGLGMVAMVAGQLIPVGGQVATALVMGGMATSTLGSVGVSALENYTKAGGPTEEDKKAMLQELGTSLALVGTGMGIGKGSEAIFRTLVMKNCPKLIAFAAEVGVDATASLLADYAITGQIDLSGEGIAQLQNILVGIIGAKGARNYLNTHAGKINNATDISTKPLNQEVDFNARRNYINLALDKSHIRKMSQAEIDKLKIKDPNIKQLSDGTIVKVDTEGKTKVIGIIDKIIPTKLEIESSIKLEIKNLDKANIPQKYKKDWSSCKELILNLIKKLESGIVKFDENFDEIILKLETDITNLSKNVSLTVRKQLEDLKRMIKDLIQSIKIELNPKNTFENKIKYLSEIKDPDGASRYDIPTIKSFIQINEIVPTKTLYALLESQDFNCVAEIKSILSNIKSFEDIRTLDILLQTKKDNFIKNTTGLNEFDIWDIEMLFDSKKDGTVEDFDVLLNKLLIEDINYLSKGASVKDTILRVLSKVQSNEQKECLELLLADLKKQPSQCYINSFSVRNILDAISDTQDLNTFKTLRNKNKEGNENLQLMWSYSRRLSGVDEDKSMLMKNVLNKLAKTDYSPWILDNILENLKYTDVDDIPLDLIFKEIDKKSDAEVVVFASSITKNDLNGDSPLMNFIKDTGNIPYDAIELKNIAILNDFQKEAFTLLLKANQNKRFEALAFKDIIENITTKENLINLEIQLKNPLKEVNDIISDLAGTSSWINKFNLDESIKINLDNYKKISKKYKKRLESFRILEPKRFNKMVESGLFDLIEAGKIDANILENINFNTFLSNRTLSDIKKIRDGESLVRTLDSKENITNIANLVDNGEVCEFNGKLFVNDNGMPVELKLSKEKFEELFPPLSSVTFKQGHLGDCYFVTTLDNCMDLPSGKVALYKLFEQKGNDIYIQFPNTTESIRFENGKVINTKGKQIRGTDKTNFAPGIQMIEQAYAVHRLDDSGNRAYKNNTSTTDAKLVNMKKLMERLEGGWQYEVVKEIFGKDITLNKYGTDLNNREEMKQLIINTANDPKVMTFFATRNKNNSKKEIELCPKYDLYSRHAYSIKGYNNETGMVYITNPWHTSVVTEVPLYELMKYIDDVNIATLN